MDDVRETSRRSVLRGAVAAGTLAWAAPVVQVIAPPAHAAGTPEPGISYIGVLLRDNRASGKPLYRVKYELEFDREGQATSIVVVAGKTWEAPTCESVSTSFYKGGIGLKASDGVLQDGAPPAGVVTQYDLYAADGGFYLVLPKGVELFAWVTKTGSCCTRQGTYDNYAQCQKDALGALYTVAYVPYRDAQGVHTGNQWLFPASPNDAACKTLGGKPYVSSVPCDSTLKPAPLQ